MKVINPFLNSSSCHRHHPGILVSTLLLGLLDWFSRLKRHASLVPTSSTYLQFPPIPDLSRDRTSLKPPAMALPDIEKQKWKRYDEQDVCDVCNTAGHEPRNCNHPSKEDKATCKKCGHWGHSGGKCLLKEEKDLDFFTPLARDDVIKNAAAAAAELEAAKTKAKVQKPKKAKAVPQSSGSPKQPTTSKGSRIESNVPGSSIPEASSSGGKAQRNPVASGTPRAGASTANTSSQSQTITNPTKLMKAEEREAARAAKDKRRKELDEKIANSDQAEWLYPRQSNGGVYPAGAERAEVLANSFIVNVINDKVYRYRIVIGKIPRPPDLRARETKKRETKRAMIWSLMQKWPDIRYASDFDSIVLTTEKLWVHTDNELPEQSISKVHQRTGRTPGSTEDIESVVKFEKILPIQDLLTYLRKPVAAPHDVATFKKANEILAMLNIVSWQKVQLVEAVGKIKKKFYPPAVHEINADGFDKSQRDINGLVFDLDGCFYARFGFFSSLRVGDLDDDQVLLNVNTTTSVFFRELTIAKWLDADKTGTRYPELMGLKVSVPGPPNVRVLSAIEEASLKIFKRNPHSKDDSKPATETETIEQHMRARMYLSSYL